ncbi:MoaD/ThiS family protein [Paucidesulfovibrio longus]|uniref:MoaD/ThiS family protein n=1 Tax=Paucidesulfovibrio longus TaxID=889 RepID=UPI0003B3765E|nr:MoaD/ThiS family protein [Paucidesulfovibrio longus]
MNIELKCFATLGVYLPENADAFPMPDGSTVADVMAALNMPAEEVRIIFVNGVKREPDSVLKNGDRVGLFPAVGGG